MQFNSNPTQQDIVSYSRKKVGANSVSLPIEDIVTYANEAVRIIRSWIAEAYGGWQTDDYNNTDVPEATNDLVANVADYILPDGLTDIFAVSFKLKDSDVWEKLYPRTVESIQQRGSVDERGRVASVPLEYRLTGNVLTLIPAPDYSQDDSLRLHLNRDTLSFSTGDTTKEPGFPLFHEAIPTFIAWQHAKMSGLSNAKDLEKEWSNENMNYPPGYAQVIKKHYSSKFREMFPPRIVNSDVTNNYR